MRIFRLLIACSLYCLPLIGSGQSYLDEGGLPYLVNFPPSVYDGFSQNWAVIQSNQGWIYFGNGDGVLEFDGVSWRLIPVANRTVVRSLAKDSTGTLFVGATHEIGYLASDSMGALQYVSLLDHLPADKRNFGQVLGAEATLEGVYFHTLNRLFRWDGKAFTIWEDHHFSFTGYVNGAYYFTDEDRGTYVLAGDSIQLVIPPAQLASDRIRHFLPYSDQEILICLDKGPFMRFDGEKLQPLDGSINRYLDGTRIVNVQALSDNTYAFATYEKGMLIADREGRILQIVNKESGLNTNLIFDVWQGMQGGLWLAMDNGAARVESISPLSSFDTRNGLEGPVNGLIRHRGSLYAATGLGIYRLNSRTTDDISARFQLVDPLLQIQGFSFLAIEEDLLIASGRGLFLIRENRVEKINEMRNSLLYQSPYFPDRVYVGKADGLGLIERVGGEWVTRGNIAGLESDTRRLYESAPNRLWAGFHAGGIVRIELKENPSGLPGATITRFSEADGLPAGYVTMRKMRGKLTFRRDSDMYRFDPETSRFERDTSFAGLLGIPDEILSPDFEDKRGNIWLLEKLATGAWQRRVARLQPDSTYKLEAINSQRMTQDADWVLYPEGDSILWYGGTDGVVRTCLDSIEPADIPYAAAVRRVSVKGDSIVFGGGINRVATTFEYASNAMRFEYAAATFDAMEVTRFQFLLEGFDPDWSDWTRETRRDYTNLPEGSYRFRVRAVNVYGRISEEGVFTFVILPPWYRSWWAYGLYAIGAIFLIWGIIRWRLQQVEAEKAALEQTVQARTKVVATQNIRLEQQTRQLKELDMLKSRFFANISHEFRTPLTLILGPLEDRLMKDQEGTGEEDRMMHRNAQRLLRLVNQLLDLSRLESGSMQLVPEKGELAAFFRAVIAAFDSLAQQQQIEFDVQTPNREWKTGYDRDKLEKILYNLLSNAFKFTPTGGSVSVQIEFEETQGLYSIRVHNTGSWIPIDQQSLIFDRFYQLGADSHQGTGIGLALVKELVNLQGGTIGVKSDAVSGTEFQLQLPVLEVGTNPVRELPDSTVPAEAPPLTLQTVPPDAPATDTSLPEILLVEDNADVRTYLRGRIDSDYQIREAVDGVEGVEMAREHVPDLIITDLMMPRMDGVDLCRKLKTDERTSHIPIILLTAKANIESRIEGLETGADDYLTKPFHQQELLTRVRNLIQQRKLLRERFRKELILQPREMALTSLDERFLDRVVTLVENHLEDPDFSVKAFREALGMSKTQVHRKLTALTDQAPGEFIRTYRLKRAAQLLAAHHENVSQIAFSVGFNNLSYFAKCFKEQFGVSPSQYAAQAPN